MGDQATFSHQSTFTLEAASEFAAWVGLRSGPQRCIFTSCREGPPAPTQAALRRAPADWASGTHAASESPTFCKPEAPEAEAPAAPAS